MRAISTGWPTGNGRETWRTGLRNRDCLPRRATPLRQDRTARRRVAVNSAVNREKAAFELESAMEQPLNP